MASLPRELRKPPQRTESGAGKTELGCGWPGPSDGALGYETVWRRGVPVTRERATLNRGLVAVFRCVACVETTRGEAATHCVATRCDASVSSGVNRASGLEPAFLTIRRVVGFCRNFRRITCRLFECWSKPSRRYGPSRGGTSAAASCGKRVGPESTETVRPVRVCRPSRRVGHRYATWGFVERPRRIHCRNGSLEPPNVTGIMGRCRSLVPPLRLALPPG